MSTSGSQNFSQTMSQIIYDAYTDIGVYGEGRTVSSFDFNYAKNKLNRMIKAWSAKGLHLWEKTEATLFTTLDTAIYSVGNSSTDSNIALASDIIITRLNGTASAAATSLTVDSTTGMIVGDYIGIVLTDLSTHWTTIATIPTSTTLTLASGLISAASDDTYVYTYTNKIYKPQRILDARIVSGYDNGSTSTLTEVVMNSIAYQEYMQLPNKTNRGQPNLFHYNPKLTSGNFYIWPRPNDTRQRINFTYERLIEDVDNVTNDFDFPSEWLEPLTLQLSIRLCPRYGKSKKMQQLMPLAIDSLNQLMMWDSEIDSVQFIPDVRKY